MQVGLGQARLGSDGGHRGSTKACPGKDAFSGIEDARLIGLTDLAFGQTVVNPAGRQGILLCHRQFLARGVWVMAKRLLGSRFPNHMTVGRLARVFLDDR